MRRLRWSPGASASLPRGTLLRAAVTPLASIFGSGFLIIVPILERTLGAYAALGMAVVLAIAWWAGNAIRHNVAVVEPMLADGSLDRRTRRVETTADWVIVGAYVASVALYVRILAGFVVGYVSDGSATAERIVACAVIGIIVVVGVTRGFDGLDKLERVALVAVLVLVTVLITTFAVLDAGRAGGDGLHFASLPGDVGLLRAILVLGGIVITVQGFETVRFLGDEFDAETRIAASRLAQLAAAVVYLLFVVVATPLMHSATGGAPDSQLLDFVQRVAGALALPLVLCAVLSQFSAATADTVAADGNVRVLPGVKVTSRTVFLAVGMAGCAMAATLPTFTLVAVASRAFAAYYGLTAYVAMRTSTSRGARVSRGTLALVMLLVAALALPAE